MPIWILVFMFIFFSQADATVNDSYFDRIKLTFENYLRVGGDPMAFRHLICFLRTNNSRYFIRDRLRHSDPNLITIRNREVLIIADLTKPSDRPRLFVLDLKNQQVKAYLTAHGSGNPGQSVALYEEGKIDPIDLHRILFPYRISNEIGSNATPRGLFILDETYRGQFGYSLRMHGLQKRINDNSLKRFIVLHGFNGMNPAYISSFDQQLMPVPQGNLALSQGCTMLEPRRAKEVIDLAQGGSLYYVFTNFEKNYGPDYCADENLMAVDLPVLQ
jgi:hypothetical protein